MQSFLDTSGPDSVRRKSIKVPTVIRAGETGQITHGTITEAIHRPDATLSAVTYQSLV